MNFRKLKSKEWVALMAEAKAKFLEHGRGINMSTFIKNIPTQNTKQVNEVGYHDLISNDYSISSVRTKGRALGKKLANQLQDPVFFPGEDVEFTHITPLEKRVEFSTLECYVFMRSIYLTKLANTTELERASELKAALAERDSLKSRAERKKELDEKISELS